MNFNRQYRVLAGVPGTVGFEIGEEVNGRALHVTFDLEKTDTQSSNTGKLSIFNLNEEHKAVLNEPGCVVELRAGYADNMGTIFVGGVSNPTETIQNADRVIEMELIDGLSNYFQVGSVSQSGIVTCKEALDNIVGQMGVESFVITDAANELLEKASYDAGYCYVGKLKMALQNICSKAGVTFSLQNGILQVHVAGEAITLMAYKLSAETGLISVPKKITITQTSGSSSGTSPMKSNATSGAGGEKGKSDGIPGYEVEYFINGAIGVNDLVQLESKVASGIFRVYKQSIKGDNYGQDWKCVSQLAEVTV